ncbi:MAG: nitric oxide reductase transcriptional regulator NorR [Proteobacteria bacterium]|nr:nitric oxide reductase transcriptional regulator NorR [Pseudomonadota bacterium]MCP4917356.1 nitric oxide reductase transcriptional regulator NorR [Pseudomonadota bacterium]
MLSSPPRDRWQPLVDIAQDLCANLATDDRQRRMAAAIRRLLPCDAATILRLDEGTLVPVVADGLRPEVLGRRFRPADHPRLARLLTAEGTVRFTGSTLPDPFDGLLCAGGNLSHVHACMGAPLVVEGEVIGVLTVDSLDPTAFDDVADEIVAAFAGLAGAAVRTSQLIDALELAATRQRMLASQLMRDANRQAGELLGRSEPLVRLRDEIESLARSDLTALITGETGVGKELVAQAVHAQSPRHDRPLIRVNCAALPESIAESELFGHIRGSFTGATGDRAGKFELADRGTLFLDEVGELPASIQPKLLRVLQSGEVQRVGSDRPHQVDVRILAATNRDLAEEVRAGRFRADLYHRLSVYPLAIPPLRDRRGDVLLLAGHFLDRARVKLGLGAVRLGESGRAELEAYDWPGNVRELEHVMVRAALRASRGQHRDTVVVEDEHLALGPPHHAAAPGTAPSAPVPGQTLRAATDAFTRRTIERAVADSDGNWAEAARRLGVQRSNLHRLAARLELK